MAFLFFTLEQHASIFVRDAFSFIADCNGIGISGYVISQAVAQVNLFHYGSDHT